MSGNATRVGKGDARREQFERLLVETRPNSRLASLVLALLSLGYTRIRWSPRAGGFFTATDCQGIPSIIVVDAAPIRDGFPKPKLSPARAKDLQLLCVARLEDNRRLRYVRADYVALPDLQSLPKRLALTLRRGVAWAFAEGSTSRQRTTADRAGRG